MFSLKFEICFWGEINYQFIINVGWSRNVLVSKDHGANMGPIWGRQDTGGLHVDHMNFAIWGF